MKDSRSTECQMNRSGDPVLELTTGLIRRERGLLVLLSLLQGFLVSLLAPMGALLLMRLGLAAPRAGFTLLAATATGMTAAILFPLLARWKSSGNPLRQAALVESLRPGLRGRLLTVVEKSQAPVPGESRALLLKASQNAALEIVHIKASEVHPAHYVKWLSRGVFLMVATTIALSLTASRTPWGAMFSLFTQPASSNTVAPHKPSDDTALVGDIVLRYLYPAYTGLEPLLVPNSTGRVHGPLGTLVQVFARTASRYQKAQLLLEPRDGFGVDQISWRPATEPEEGPAGNEEAASDEAPPPANPSSTAFARGSPTTDPSVEDKPASMIIPTRLEDGRDVESSFELRFNGTWRLLLLWGGVTERSPAYAMEIEPDLSPDVIVEAPSGPMEVPLDQPLPVDWSTRDDFGIIRVEAVVEWPSGASITKTIQSPLDPSVRMQGSFSLSPAELGLMPGERVNIVVQAWDNDAVSGSKAGRSRPIVVSVLGPRGQTTRRLRMVRELRDILVDILADFLEETSQWKDPPALPDSRHELSSYAQILSKRMQPVQDILDRYWDGFQPDTFEGTVLAAVGRSHDSLLSLVATLGNAATGQDLPESDLHNLRLLRQSCIASIEKGILTLDQVVRQRALNSFAELLDQAAQEARSLTEMDLADTSRLLARLDRLERQLRRIRDAAKDMADGSLPEMINSNIDSASQLLQEIRSALADGRTEDARKLMDRLAKALSQMVDELKELQQRGDASSQDRMQEIQNLANAIQDMEDRQRALADTTAQKNSAREDAPSSLENTWGKLLEKATSLEASVLAFSSDIRKDTPNTPSLDRLSKAVERGGQALRQAIAARDPERSLDQAREVEWTVTRVLKTLERDRQQQGLPGMESNSPLLAQGQELKDSSMEIRQLLEDLLNRLSPASDAVSGDYEGIAARQVEISGALEDAREKARSLAPGLPMGAPGLEDALEQAAQQMATATELLARGTGSSGEIAQRVAADNLADANQALRRALREAADMSSLAMPPGSGQQVANRDGSGRGAREVNPPERLGLPTPEEFATPEAYRKALLRGMQADVPTEYESMKKRYYQELVQQ